MTPERQRIAEEIFKEARALPIDDRRRFLESKCANDTQLLDEVQSLLTWFGRESGMLDNTPPLLDGVTEADAAAALLPPGGKVGPYKILSVLGVGGMGVVYVAEQQRPQRTVALKVIRPGLASPSVLRRLEYEAELLGRLQHPGIANVIEAGTADAGFGLQPYFAMELVKGSPLNIYCAEKKLNTRDRLRLIELICDAVEHAHRRGVIHRDLKPANILVDESGQPKILDFGVARATASKDGDQRLTMLRTGERQLIGTLAYMSPEQVGGDPASVDFRSDVYALGIILYELLSGQPPHDISNKALPDALRVIRDQDAKPLRTLNTSYKGDLDTIAAKALEKNPARRYQSAAELGADIQRSLANLPINARPASALYQLTKFTHRNKALVTGASIALIALVAGLVISTVQYSRASRAATRSEQVSHLLKGMIGGINPRIAQARDTALLKEIVDNTAKTVGTSLHGQPTVEAELRAVIGDVYFSIGEYKQAEEQYRAAHALYEQAVGRKSAEYSDTSIKLMNVLTSTNRYDEAITVSQEAVETRSKIFGTNSDEVAEAYACLGEAQKRSDLPAAIANLEKATAMYERSNGSSSLAVARTLEHLGGTYIEGGHPEEAEKALKRSFEIRNKELGAGHMDTVNVAGLLGNVYVMKQRYAEAEPFCRVYAEQMAKLMPKDHAATPLAWASLALAVQKQGRLGEAITLYRAQIEPLTRILGADDLNVGTFHNNLGSVLVDAGEFEAAEPEYTEALRVYRTAGANMTGAGAENLRVPFALLGLANVEWARGNYTASEKFARQAFEVGTRVLPEKHAALGASALRLAACEIELANTPNSDSSTPNSAATPTTPQARAVEAVALAEKAISDFSTTMGEDHFNVWQARTRLGTAHATQAALLAASKDNAEAAKRFATAEAELLLVQRTLLSRPDLGAFPGRETTQSDIARVLARMYKAWDAIAPDTGKQKLADESAANAVKLNAELTERRKAALQ